MTDMVGPPLYPVPFIPPRRTSVQIRLTPPPRRPHSLDVFRDPVQPLVQPPVVRREAQSRPLPARRAEQIARRQPHPPLVQQRLAERPALLSLRHVQPEEIAAARPIRPQAHPLQPLVRIPPPRRELF